VIALVLSSPLSGLDLPETLELGPFSVVGYEDGWFYGDGERVAEVFAETADDMLGNVTGHPAAGAVFVPRTFGEWESSDPEYPGKGYERVTIETVEDPK
jgi:hypothetical protein